MKKFAKSLLLSMFLALFFGLTANAAVQSVTITSPTTYPSMRIARKTADDRNVQIKADVKVTGTSSKALTYTSNNPSVATVNQSGVVTLKKAGVVTITVASKENPSVKDTLKFTVVQKVTEIQVRQTLRIYPGKTWQFVAKTLPANAEKPGVFYYSKNTSIATITSAGKLTSIKPGTATIVAKANDGVVGSHIPKYVYITVTVVKPVTSITLKTQDSKTAIYRGATTTVTATVSPSDAFNKAVTFSSSNPSIATVDAKGVVTAVSPGYATITATAKDGFKGTGSIRIQVLDTRMNVNAGVVSTGFTMQVNGVISCTNVPQLENTLSQLGKEIASIAGFTGSGLDATVVYNGRPYVLKFNVNDGIRWENSEGKSVFELINNREFGQVTLAIPAADANYLQVGIAALQTYIPQLKNTYTFPTFTWGDYTISNLTINRNGMSMLVNGTRYETYLKYNVLYFKGDLRNDPFVQYLAGFTGGILTIRP